MKTCAARESSGHALFVCSVRFKVDKASGVDWVNKTIKKNRIVQVSVSSLCIEIHGDDNDLTSFVLETNM